MPDDCIGIRDGWGTTRWTYRRCQVDGPFTPPVDVCLVDGEPHGDYVPGVGGVLDRRGTTARFFQPCHLAVTELPATGAGVAAVALIAGGLVFVGLAAWAAALKGRAN